MSSNGRCFSRSIAACGASFPALTVSSTLRMSDSFIETPCPPELWIRPAHDFSGRLIVRVHLPLCDQAIAYYRSPRRRHAPVIILRQSSFRRVSRFRRTKRRHYIPMRENFRMRYAVIGKHAEIARPTLAHRFAALHAVPQSIHKHVVFGHQRAEPVHIRRINAFHEGENNLDRRGIAHKMASLPPEV